MGENDIRNDGPCGHIILIGFMGAGKSTVGRILSRKLSLPLLDTDAMIEEKAQMPISRIFARKGENAFRETESQVLKDLLQRREPAVISTGGGMPMREENRQLLRSMGTVVYLRVEPPTVIKRLASDRSRPLLQGGDRQEKITELLKQREPLYADAAHISVDTDSRRPEKVADEIRKRINL